MRACNICTSLYTIWTNLNPLNVSFRGVLSVGAVQDGR